jgi:hypothetical protein
MIQLVISGSEFTQEEFDNLCCNLKFMRVFASLSNLQPILITPAASTPTPSSSPTSASSNSALSPVDIFKRGVKRDHSLYPTLKDELWNDNWHRSFANQARTQDFSEVLDPAYLPATPTEISLFQEKKKYLYAILESKVETAKGKAIIRKHESTFDAQKAYEELQEYHLNSTKASLISVKILVYITSAKIGNGSWHGTSENFILNWQEKIRLYERLTPPSSHFSHEQSLLCSRLLFILFKNFAK